MRACGKGRANLAEWIPFFAQSGVPREALGRGREAPGPGESWPRSRRTLPPSLVDRAPLQASLAELRAPGKLPPMKQEWVLDNDRALRPRSPPRPASRWTPRPRGKPSPRARASMFPCASGTRVAPP